MNAGPAGSSLEARFAQRIEALLGNERPALGVALSGGGDSLALAALLAEWAGARGIRAVAFTVDHGLRPGSRAEAERAAAAAAGLGLEQRLLSWQPEDGLSRGLQARARAARYNLLAAACREEGIEHLCLAHTLEDQAETFLLRLESQSDLPGLACMAARSRREGLTLLRPLLAFGRAELRAWLKGRGLSWIEDPSNSDRRFARVRLRELLPALEREGVAPRLLAATAGDLGRLRARLEGFVSERLERSVTLRREGFIEAERETLLAAPGEIAGWALARCLRALGGQRYPPRRERLERLLRALRSESFTAATLAGCRLQARGEDLLILREARALPPAREIVKPGRQPWDGRFCLDLGQGALGCRLAALGPDGWRQLRAADLIFAKKIKARDGAPLAALQALPALFDASGLAEIPPLGWRRADLPRSLCLSSAVKLLIPLK